MQQLVFFIQRYKYFLLFLILQFFALLFTINNHNFHKSKFISSANSLTGNLFQKTSNASSYFSLKSQNTILINENEELRNELEKLKHIVEKNNIYSNLDSIKTSFNYINGQIIKNEYLNSYNFMTINRGKKDNIRKELGVINSKGIIGITEETSNSYTRVQSILNGNSLINAKFKNDSHYGTLTWDGKDYNIVQLTDIPRQAIYKKGDTIITGGKSSIFPEGIDIGTVIQKTETNTSFNTINIKLFNDMSDLKYIYIIENFDKDEIKTLERKF